MADYNFIEAYGLYYWHTIALSMGPRDNWYIDSLSGFVKRSEELDNVSSNSVRQSEVISSCTK